MKQAYTQFIPKLKSFCKERGLDHHAVLNRLADESEKHPDDMKLWSSGCQLSIDVDVIDREALHLFITSNQFAEWIISCVKAVECAHADTLQDLIGKRAAVLHFPTGPGAYSFGFRMSAIGRMSQGEKSFRTLVVSASKDDPACDGFCTPLDYGADPERKFGNETIEKRAKLIVGLGMYCSCFPETVKNGPPDNVKHPAHHKYLECKSIGISPQITHGTHDSPTAHFRRGHFRVLRSEKFKNKRFQAVFVHETFVNGKAKTVLSPEEVTA